MSLNEPQAAQLVDKLIAELRLRQSDIHTWNAYYSGNHPLVFASDEWKKAHSARYGKFADNWCAVVADSPAERLQPTGIRLPDGTSGGVADSDLWRAWQVNGCDAESSAGFVDLEVSSRTFALVWGNDDDDVEITWESPSEVIVAYEPGSHRRRTAALKVWREDEFEMATLYLPDELWKFRRALGESTRIEVMGVDPFRWRPREIENEPNPMPNPLGLVPIVEMPNRPRLDGTARSEIAGVAPMQDAINLLWAYLFTTADFASFPQRVVLGQQPPKVPKLNAQGDVIGEEMVPLDKFASDRVVWLTGKESKVDQWDAADLKQFTDIIEVQVGHIAAQTRTPPHYLVSNKGLSNLSGDALVAAETGLVKKVEEQQTFIGPRLQELFRLVALAQGDNRKAEAVRAGKILWRDAESRSDHQMADKIIKLRQAGFPFRWLVEEYGLSPTDVNRVMELRAEEMREASQADLAAMFGDPTAVGDTDVA